MMTDRAEQQNFPFTIGITYNTYTTSYVSLNTGKTKIDIFTSRN